MIRLELPLPPSSNNAYINVLGRGRVRSKAHAEWKRSASWEMVLSCCGSLREKTKIEGPFRLAIYLPNKIRGDVSNRVKLAEDLLVELGVTPDDRHAVSVHAERSADVAPGRCLIVVEAAHEPAEDVA